MLKKAKTKIKARTKTQLQKNQTVGEQH